MERVLMPDLSFHLFKIISTGDFAIQNYRFGAFFTQIFPWIGLVLDLDLKTIVDLYSLSFPILYFVIFLVLAYMKSEKYIVVLFLYIFCMTTHSFFWPISEIHQGVVWLILYMAFVDCFLPKHSYLKLACISVVLLPMIIFLYPLLIVSISFICFYLNQKPDYKKFTFYLGFGSILIFILKLIFVSTGYDSDSMYRVFDYKSLLNVVYLKSTRDFFGQVIANYYVWLIGFLFVMGMNTFYKRWYANFILSGGSFALVLMVCICYELGGQSFYLEGQYMQLSFFFGLSLVHDYWQSWSRRARLTILGLVFISFCGRIAAIAPQYSQRIMYYRELIAEYGSSKTVIRENSQQLSLLKMTWSSAYEVWILSTMDHGQTASIIIDSETEKHLKHGSNGHVFVEVFESHDYSQLNSKYFIFKDTMNSYKAQFIK